MKEFWNFIQMVFMAVGGWLGWFMGGCDDKYEVSDGARDGSSNE